MVIKSRIEGMADWLFIEDVPDTYTPNYRLVEKEVADRGSFISPQRRAVISERCKIGSIDDVEDFWLSVRQRHHVGWSTVYNTIKLLVQERMVCVQFREKRGQRYFLAAHLGEASGRKPYNIRISYT